MRPDQRTYFLQMARLVASRSNCYRRVVGCVLVDRFNNVLSTGYNGVPRGVPHCPEGQCLRESSPSGENLDRCLATHAEQNALLTCHDVYKIDRAYVTTSPCKICTSMLLNTSCEEIIFDEIYPGSELAKKTWIECGRKWTGPNSHVSYRIVLGAPERIS